jgi:hypothetical protein
MKTCVYIPCVEKHIPHLKDALDSYTIQSKLPDQVMIAFNKITKDIDFDFEPYHKYFDISFTIEKVSDDNHRIGTARQLAENSYCDIIIYADADDIAHYQRVEIIHHIKSNYDVVHINHGFTMVNAGEMINQTPVDMSAVRMWLYGNQPPYYTYGMGGVHCGALSIRKEMLDIVKWDNYMFGEDKKYCETLSSKLNKSVVIDTPLYFYRNYLSSDPLNMNKPNGN